ARSRHEGARSAQLSPAGQRHDHLDPAGRPRRLPARHRARAAHHGGFRGGPDAWLTIAFPRRVAHLSPGTGADTPQRAFKDRIMLQDGGATATAPEVVKDTTTQGFVKDVIEESRRQPVLVDFWAPWCGPCKQLTPVLEKAVRGAKGKAKLVKMNIDEHPSIPGQMGIQSIPAVIAFVNGQPIDGFLGALPESQVTAFIERLIKDRVGGEEKDLLKQADAALAEGDATAAADIYADILAK